MTSIFVYLICLTYKNLTVCLQLNIIFSYYLIQHNEISDSCFSKVSEMVNKNLSMFSKILKCDHFYTLQMFYESQFMNSSKCI